MGGIWVHPNNPYFLLFINRQDAKDNAFALRGRPQSTLLFTQQGIHFFFAFFETWRWIPKDQVRIYRMILLFSRSFSSGTIRGSDFVFD
jgi:hypothetical protein